MIKSNIGLFITRAQPGLHIGQLDGIQQAIEQGIKRIIIAIGSANKELTTENPFTYEERKEMVQLACTGLKGVSIEIFPLPDMQDDDQRKTYILKKLPPVDYIITGNIRTKEIFEHTKKIIRLKIREEVKGAFVREQLIRGNSKGLEKMLPATVVKYLMDIHAPQRMRDIMSKEHRSPSLTVDMIFQDNEGNLILIDRKTPPHGIALPGGFVEYGENPEDAAIRETQEETGAKVSIKSLVGVYGKPGRDTRLHTVTIVYEGKYIGGTFKVGDEAKKIVKIHISKALSQSYAFDHKKIISDYLKLKNKKK